MDQKTGELWLTEEKYAQAPKRIKQITGDVILALAADIIAVDDTRMASREVRFSDGVLIRITVEEIKDARTGSELSSHEDPN